MVQLARHLQRLKRAQTLLGAAALLAAVSLWALDLRTNARRAALLEAHVADASAQWQSHTLNTEAARNALDEAARINGSVQSVAPRISAEMLNIELNALARDTGVRRLSIQSALPGTFHSLTDCPVVVDFQGDLSSDLRFLRDAETGARPARLQGVKMKAIDAGRTQFEVQASLEFYGSN